MFWPLSIFFGSDEESPTYVVEGSMAVIFSPQLGVDKAKMLKELESILGKDGKNVVTAEDVAELRFPYNPISEEVASNADQAFELFKSQNRGRNGDSVTILSKAGLAKLVKFGDINEGMVETKFGWKVYLEDNQPEKSARNTYINEVLKAIPAYSAKLERDESFGIPIKCPGCGNSFNSHRWMLGYDEESEQALCHHCSTPIRTIGYDWATKTLQEIRIAEESFNVRFLPKEVKAA